MIFIPCSAGYIKLSLLFMTIVVGAQWFSGRVLGTRPRGRGFEPHGRHWVVSLSKNIYPSLVLVQPRKTCPFITERLLMGCKESNQTKIMTICLLLSYLLLYSVSLYSKQYGPKSDCSLWSSLIWVHTVYMQVI